MSDNRTSNPLALLPCPFCGGEAVFEHVDAKGTDEHRWSVGCSAMPDNFMPGRDVLCHGNQSFNTYPRKIDAAKAWNTRPSASQQSETTEHIPARPYPGDEAAVRQSGIQLPYCTCVARCDDDPHKPNCRFWQGILAARKAWHDKNVAAWSCSEEAAGRKACTQWCGHPQFCTAVGTDRRAVKAGERT